MNVSSWVILIFQPLIGYYTDQLPHPSTKRCNQLVAKNNLTHVHEITRHNNILDRVMSKEEELILNLKIKFTIGDHQAIQFSIKTEN